MLPFEARIKSRKRIYKRSAFPSEKCGVYPDKRSPKSLITHGVVNLDKPKGPSSHQVSAWVKIMLGLERAGHGGTLDPNVTGVLPMLLGNATKASEMTLLGGKEYVGVMRLHRDMPKKRVKAVFDDFIGDIYQVPPVRSAVKRERRVREIYELEAMEVTGRDILFRVQCESGTYIRTLCVDVGEALGVGGHMQELRRTQAGILSEDSIFTLQELKDAFVMFEENDDDTELRRVVLPMEKLFDPLPRMVVRDSAVDAICHGANLALPGLLEFDSDVTHGEPVLIATQKGEAIATGKALLSADRLMDLDKGVAADISRVFMEPGTYPRMWGGKK